MSQTCGVDLESSEMEGAIGLSPADFGPDWAFVVFDQQDSGCISYGIEIAGRRWFVKTATTPDAAASLDNAFRLHRACRHPSIVRPVRRFEMPAITLVYPWRNGTVLNHATVAGSDRSALERFRALHVRAIEDAIGTVLDAHLEIVDSGFVAVDFYDGCLLYDFVRDRMWLIDLDEYRPGPFIVNADRLPGSTSYMAPEEFVREAIIDERTTVFGLGQMIHHLLTANGNWRGTTDQRALVEVATDPLPQHRHETVAALLHAWGRSLSAR